MARTITFKMALDNDPERERTWEYKPLSLKGIKKGQIPKFIVVEKGVGIIHLTVERDNNGIHFIVHERTEFTTEDSQRAVGMIMQAIYKVASSRGILDQVDKNDSTH